MRSAIGLRERLTRATSSGRFLPEVDGLRFIAIAAVVLFHASGRFDAWHVKGGEPSALGIILRGGDAGVRLFFIVSGFILGLPFAEARLAHGPRVSVRAYFLRRLTRLEPPYLVCMVTLATLLTMTAAYPPAVIARHLAPSLVYQHGLVFGSWPLVNYVAWSLEVEIQFYVLAPAFAAVFALSPVVRRLVLGAVIALGSGADAFLAPEGVTRWWLSLPAHAHYFAIGFLLADLRATRWRLPRAASRGWDLVGAAAWVSLIPLRGQPLAYALAFPALAGVATAAVMRGRALGAIARWPVFTTIGGMCYTIYLWHTTIIENLAPLTLRLAIFEIPWLERLTHVLVLLILAVAVSIPLYLLFEKPFMFRDWPARALRRPWSIWMRPGVLGAAADDPRRLSSPRR